MNLTEQLSARAEVGPGAVAIVDRSCGRRRMLTFAGLEAAAAAGAHRFHAAGIGPGDRVFFAQPVSIELYTGLLSVLRVGATAIFADVSSGRGHLEKVCETLRPKAFFGSGRAQLLRLTSPAIRRIPIRFSTGRRFGAAGWNTDGGETFSPVDVPGDHPALISFTSGSTGEPKVIARSHGFLLAQGRGVANALHLEPGEADLVTLPMFALANLAAGVTSVLADTDLRRPGTPDAAAICRQLEEDGIVRATASPAFFAAMLESGADLGRLRKIFTGGAPVFPRLIGALQEAAPEAKIVSVYGSSEAEPIACLEAGDVSEADHGAMVGGAGLLVGRPVPDIALKILPSPWNPRDRRHAGDDFEKLALPVGRTGEIVVSGAHVLRGYLDGNGDAGSKIRVGKSVWHRTGDMGRVDESGRLWLLGRCEATVRDDTGMLHPLSAECALSYLPEVRTAAVISHAGKRVAVIEASPAVGLRRIQNAVPWAEVDAVLNRKIPLDRRHNAKVDYPALRAGLREF